MLSLTLHRAVSYEQMVNDKVSVIDVKGELTAFAEGVLMQAYTQGWHRPGANGRVVGVGHKKSEADSPTCTPPRKIPHRFR
jgi:hypothetical protein